VSDAKCNHGVAAKGCAIHRPELIEHENDRLRARVAELEQQREAAISTGADDLSRIVEYRGRIDALERDLATARSDKLRAETAAREATVSREAAEAKIIELRGIVAALTAITEGKK